MARRRAERDEGGVGLHVVRLVKRLRVSDGVDELDGVLVGRLRVRGEVLLHGAKGPLPVVRGGLSRAAVLGKDALVNEGQAGCNIRAGAGLLLAGGLKSRSRRVSREGRRDGDLCHLVGGKAGVGIDALPADLGGPPGGSHVTHGAVGALDDGQAVHHVGAYAAGERRGDALRATGHALAERDAVDVVHGDLAVVVGGVRGDNGNLGLRPRRQPRPQARGQP